MKVIVLLFCAVAGASAGNAVAWPGGIPLATAVRTVIPPQIKAFGYSTSEYINTVPSAAIGYHPQLSYQISVPSYQHYQPIVSASYYPSNNILYPSLTPAASFAPIYPVGPISPIAPTSPIKLPGQNVPASTTEQPPGDEDSAVIEAADSSSSQQQPFQPQPSNPPQTSLDTKNMPGFPQIPQAPQQFPLFPQFSQFVQQGANFPPQQFEFQQNPSFPQAPSPSPSFPSTDNSNKELIDEDTVAVDSA